jgi:hypothetical protein
VVAGTIQKERAEARVEAKPFGRRALWRSQTEIGGLLRIVTAASQGFVTALSFGREQGDATLRSDRNAQSITRDP